MYFLLYSLFYLLSLLPFTVLYLLSDGLYFILYRCVGYRKEVVLENLRIAFPEKNLEERLAITKKYYHNLCDSIVETIKMFSISEHELNKRVACDHWSVLEEMTTFAKNGQGFVAHQFNWEWATLLCNKNRRDNLQGFIYLLLIRFLID
jgi:KDO2-lipid IV(A) lauroyltransferase